MRMSDSERIQQAETDALESLKKAAEDIGREQDREGLTGDRRAREMSERLRPLEAAYEQKRLDRMVEERNGNMLRRGTWRGVAIVVGLSCLLWSAGKIRDALTFEPGGTVAVVEGRRDPGVVGKMWFERHTYRRVVLGEACIGLMFVAGCFYVTQRLSRSASRSGSRDKPEPKRRPAEA